MDALGNRATSIYDAVGQVTASVDALGRRTTAVFDAVGNVVEMQDALGNRTTSVFDAANRQIASVDALGRRTTTVFDVRGQVEAMVDGLGTFTQSLYDANGNTLASIDALGNRTTSVYDELNRAYAQVDALGNRTTSVFDAVGNRIASIDALGRRTTFNYDALNRIITKTDALNGVESYTFDSRGNRTSLTDPVGNTTTWVYDSLNRVTTETDPLGANKTFAYDEIGKLISQTDRLGKRRDFGYDAVDRRTSEVWFTSGTAVQTQTWNYDAAHQLLSTSDPDGTYTYTYDDAGRVSTVQQSFSLTLTFQYDAVGNRTRVQDSKGGTTTITFDTRNRQTVEELGGSGITGVKQTRTYTLNDQLATATRETYTMGMWQTAGTSTYSYDALDRTTGITHKNNMGMAIATYVYAYDAENRLTSEVLNGTTRTYSYDNTNQLTSDAGTAYSYDANGNRNMSGYSTGAGNRISTDGVRTYTHDANGNVTQTTVGANGETWVYGYDHRNQLLTAAYSATSGGAVTKRVTFAYDSYGNKISREAWDGTTTSTERYGHDGWDTAKPAPIGNENFDVWVDLDGSNNLTTRRMYGPEFDGVTLRQNASGDVGWYLTDRLGSVRGIANGSGTPLTTLTYNAWGEVLTNSTPAQSDSRTYTGRIADTLIGGYDYRDRWFLHSRFLQQDFEGFTPGDPNLYRYVGNGPTNGTDPSGKDEIKVVGNDLIYYPTGGKMKSGQGYTLAQINGYDPKGNPYVNYGGVKIPVWLLEQRASDYKSGKDVGWGHPNQLNFIANVFWPQAVTATKELYPMMGSGNPKVSEWGQAEKNGLTSGEILRQQETALNALKQDELQKKLQSQFAAEVAKRDALTRVTLRETARLLLQDPSAIKILETDPKGRKIAVLRLPSGEYLKVEVQLAANANFTLAAQNLESFYGVTPCSDSLAFSGSFQKQLDIFGQYQNKATRENIHTTLTGWGITPEVYVPVSNGYVMVVPGIGRTANAVWDHHKKYYDEPWNYWDDLHTVAEYVPVVKTAVALELAIHYWDKNPELANKYLLQAGLEFVDDVATVSTLGELLVAKKVGTGTVRTKLSTNGTPNSTIIAQAEGASQYATLPESTLNKRQLGLHKLLGEQGSTAVVRKSDVSMADLVRIGRVTGDEYTIFTKGGQRLIIRGYGNELRVSEQLAIELRAGTHGKWSGHTHPPGYGVTPSTVDRSFLPPGQQRSAIWGDATSPTIFHTTPADDDMFHSIRRQELMRRFYEQQERK